MHNLLYMDTLYVPLEIRYPILEAYCEKEFISIDKTDETRVFNFYGRTPISLRALRFKHNMLDPQFKPDYY